jgi:hypothetical protein
MTAQAAFGKKKKKLESRFIGTVKKLFLNISVTT